MADTPRRWALILGASSGFGAAAARAYAKAGFGIFGVHLDRRATMPSVESLIGELHAHDVPVLFVNANAADDAARAEALDNFAAMRGADDTIAVLLHSLAFGTLRPYFADSGTIGRKHMDMTVDVMAHSLVYWCQDIVARGWLVRGGRVFAMTSSGSLAMWPSYGAVSAAKCALESHIRQIAVELAPHGVTANAIMAGVTRTAALDKIPGSAVIVERALQRNPSGRLTTPEDVADCLLALTGEHTRWLTGNVLRVDGGEAIGG